jgi:PPE-repeat protein
MDFALLPPEINTGRMYDGPGSGPTLAAAAAWDGLATELHTAAASYGSVLSELSAGPWLGAASAAMTAAAEPYVAWMQSTATQAEQTATQAKAAAAAYEVTFAAMVPPPVIAANRALLQALVATNLFGQNSPTIAATETLYAEMWAQDATAMYGYAGASASATTLPPFTPAPQTTTGTSAAASAQTAASQATSTALQGLTSTAATNATSASALSTLSDLAGLILFVPGLAQTGLTPLNTTGLFTDLSYDEDELRDEALKDTEDQIAAKLGIPGYPSLSLGDAAPSTTPRLAMAWGPAEISSVTAGLGQAPTVGRLSVPPAWTVAAPEIRLAAVTLPTTSLGAAPEVMAASPGSLFSEMTLANMASRAISGTTTRGCQERTGSISRSRPGSTPTSPSGHGTTMAADIREFAEALVTLGDLRDSGLLTDEEFNAQKERLLARAIPSR